MKHAFKVIPLFCALAVSACAPINTDFSCNVTAGDKCMSIEEVNAMTEGRGTEAHRIKLPSKHSSQRYTQEATQTIWLAPWVDSTGSLHTHDIMVAKLNTPQGQNHVS